MDREHEFERRSNDRLPETVDAVLDVLRTGDYIADRALATALYLAMRLERPLFLEGQPGVGKTEAAKVLARVLERRLIRLQCYEGLDVAAAVYEWDYPRQMIEIRVAEALHDVERERLQKNIYSPEFLIRRPLLQALEPHPDGPPVLLIDELDRADEPFEAYLLELLEDFQITVPELGTLRAERAPLVVITSNRTREIHDALRRRCFYHWIDYPSEERELAILGLKAPDAARALAEQVVAFVHRLRALDLYKAPGVAESIDWTRALIALGRRELDVPLVEETLGILLKHEDDLAQVRERVAGVLQAVSGAR
jgi:MoxR-like ATPase